MRMHLIKFTISAMLSISACGKAIATKYDAPSCTDVTKGGMGNSVDPPLADMQGTSEFIPEGARNPSSGLKFDWALHPRIAAGGSPPPGWTRIVPWGQVFLPDTDSETRDVRVEVRDLRLFVKLIKGEWCRLYEAMTPIGSFYRVDFKDDSSIHGEQHNLPDGGVTFKMQRGRFFHFFPNHLRLPIPDGGIDGVYSDFEARIISNNDHQSAEAGPAIILASAAADYWKSETAPAGHVGVNNGDAAIGRFKMVTPSWQVFSMTVKK